MSYSDSMPRTAGRVRVLTPFIWIMVFLPVISLVLAMTLDWHALFEQSVNATLAPGGRPVSPFAVYTPTYVAVQVLGILIYVAQVVLARFDRNALRTGGIARPFHPGWCFFGSLVYVIGRSVIVYRDTHRGLSPLWVQVIIAVVGSVILLAEIFAALADAMSTITSGVVGGA